MRSVKTKGYQFRSGSGLKGDAGEAHNALKRLQKRRSGNLSPTDVLGAARNSRNPLHRYFTWDDTEAARQYRMEQARLLIRSIEVIYEVQEPGEEEVVEIVERAYQNLREGRGESEPYKPTTKVMEDPDLREQLLGQALREAHRWRDNYRGLEELAGIFAAIDAAA